MKEKRVELDVDFIGGEQLTDEEEVSLSTFIRSRQLSNLKKVKSRMLKREKELIC